MRRVLENQHSGRAFLEFAADRFGCETDYRLFFESLKSQRRLKFCREMVQGVRQHLNMLTPGLNPFGSTSELYGYDIYAGDGHYVEHACWDPAIDGTKYASGHFYGLDLRTHALFQLTAADRSNRRKKEHDMHALKRLEIEALRQGAPCGRKVLWVWDRAGIDAQQWTKWKYGHGIYFVSRAKENMDLTKQGEFSYDPQNPVNAGVEHDHLVHISSQAIRCVHYRCPLSGKAFQFLTTDNDLPPGIIAALYRARWDIEKVFDETKRKLHETKSWASSDNAKAVHAEFVCLAHNLLTILERTLANDEGVINEREDARRTARNKKAVAKAQRYKRGSVPDLVRQLLDRCTQRTVQFIRWVRNNLDRRDPWEAILAALRRRYAISLE